MSSTDFISSISVVPTERYVGDPQDVICIVASTSGLDDADSVITSWTGPNGVITNDDRVTINTTVENNVYTSVLHFDYIAESDEGIYTCNVTTIDHNVSLSTSLTNLIGTLCILHEHSIHIIICKYVCKYVRYRSNAMLHTLEIFSSNEHASSRLTSLH